jgi:flavin-dependent dehydrogenase
MADYDVAILGGGLAGLSLGLQLKRERPETSVLIAEKREGPAPEAAFKVGESSVELAARYFGVICGLKDHIDEHQLEKCGLRFFFPAGDNSDITPRLEWGPTGFLEVPSYQLDRGRLENEMAKRCADLGIDMRGGSRVEEVDLEGEDKQVTFSRDGETDTVSARWVVDAAGRAFLLKRKLGLAKDVEHTINASWLRLAGGLDIEEWGSDDEAWMERMPEAGLRKSSTNHLMGEGYWVWLIPLASGSISIGIVADPRFHPFEQINTLDGAMDWLSRHEPQLASALESRRDQVEDFLKIEDFAHGCERVFSPDRWCLTGEAGVFLDPFYSPGSDFIAMSNTYIGDLIKRDLAGEEIGDRTEAYNAIFLGTFQGVIQIVYTNHYASFGDAEVMQAKLVWDYVGYWSLNSYRYFHGKLCDLDFTAALGTDTQRALGLSARVAQLCRDWHAAREPGELRDGFIVARKFPGLWDRHTDLVAKFENDEALAARFAENVDRMDALAVVIFHKAASSLGHQVDQDREINPMAIGVDPGRWEEDGLFEGPGLTLVAAREMLPGIENMWLDELVRSP